MAAHHRPHPAKSNEKFYSPILKKHPLSNKFLVPTAISPHFVNVKLLTGLWRFFSGSKNGALNKSKLVGLYLTQANGKDGLTSEFNQNRQRRNGKYSHNRERA